MKSTEIAVLIPCYNEGKTIASVVKGFQQALPESRIYVFDNNSNDDTAECARKAGATVYFEPRKGKGNVVRRMFNDIEADVYVLVDGDDTYNPKDAPQMIAKLTAEKLDMVVGVRVPIAKEAYRLGHQLGNTWFNRVVRFLFGRAFRDIFSGYRVFSKRFVKSFPCHSHGFEIETEMSVHALEMHLPVSEIDTPYATRPSGSFSKLNTYRDGFRILKMILKLFKEVRPFAFFTSLFLMLSLFSGILITPIIFTYLETGLVPRFPTAFLVASLMLLAFLCLFSGVILDSVSRARLENKRLLYLTIK